MINLIEDKIQDKIYHFFDFELSDLFKFVSNNNKFNESYDDYICYDSYNFPFANEILIENETYSPSLEEGFENKNKLAGYIANHITQDYIKKVRQTFNYYFKLGLQSNKFKIYSDINSIDLDQFQIAIIGQSMFEDIIVDHTIEGYEDFRLEFEFNTDFSLFKDLQTFKLKYHSYNFQCLVVDDFGLENKCIVFAPLKFIGYNIQDWFRMFDYNNELFSMSHIDINLPILRIGPLVEPTQLKVLNYDISH